MNLFIMRGHQSLAHITDIIDLTLDPISFSGIDYWCQEARSLKITLPFSDALKRILQGDLRTVKAGFHTFWVHLIDAAGATLYLGVLKEGDFSVNYVSLAFQTVELEFTDFFGLILTLASDRLITLSAATLSPLSYIQPLIDQVINPTGFQPDTELYTNADIIELTHSLLLQNLTFQYPYDTSLWQPYTIENCLLIDAKDIFLGWQYTQIDSAFGFALENDSLYLILWLHYSRTSHGETRYYFRFRTYHIHHTELDLISTLDQDFLHDQPTFVPKPSVSSHLIIGEAHYSIRGYKAFYTGPANIFAIDLIPGEYKAHDLLSELLKITNAVLMLLPSVPASLALKNRLNPSLPPLHFTDPVAVEISQADSTLPTPSAVAVAHQSALDSISDHYQKLLAAYPYQIQITTHLYSPDYTRLALSTPYELLNHRLRFDGYNIIPHELDFDPVSLSITISGRAQYARKHTHHSTAQ